MENEILEEEIAEIVGEENTDTADDEFEYDENGDIIIPDVEENNEEEEITEETETTEAVEEAEKTAAEDAEEAEVDTTPTETENTAESEELARLRALVAKYERQGKDTLAKLGVTTDDVLGGLTQLAAEAEGKSVEDYAKELQKQKRAEDAEKLLARTEFERMAAADLAGLKQMYPELSSCNSIFDIPNFKRFGELRDKGLSIKEAYSAANPDGVRKSVAEAVAKQNLNETKAHLKSNVPKGTKDTSLRMSREDLATWREMFPNKSDKEILNLYRKTADKK